MFFDSINFLRLPGDVELRFRELKRRSSEGSLTADERRELDLLSEADQALSVIRAKAKDAAVSSASSSTKATITSRNGLPVIQVPAGTPAIDPDLVRRYLQEEGF